jgi:hypothetical protein
MLAVNLHQTTLRTSTSTLLLPLPLPLHLLPPYLLCLSSAIQSIRSFLLRRGLIDPPIASLLSETSVTQSSPDQQP